MKPKAKFTAIIPLRGNGMSPLGEPSNPFQARPKSLNAHDEDIPTRSTSLVPAQDMANDPRRDPPIAAITEPPPGTGDAPVIKDKPMSDPKDPAKDAEVEHPQLPSHDVDVPEEPETISVVTMTWNPTTRLFEKKDLGPLLLVPTGCEHPLYVNPFETKACLKSALPRDREKDANLFAAYQTNGWRSRHWAMERVEDEDDVNLEQMDKEIMDDIPIILSIQGKPDPNNDAVSAAGVGGTAGLSAAKSSNGAPPPPGPGPGRGNKALPGDRMAGPPKVAPPNPSPGRRV